MNRRRRGIQKILLTLFIFILLVIAWTLFTITHDPTHPESEKAPAAKLTKREERDKIKLKLAETCANDLARRYKTDRSNVVFLHSFEQIFIDSSLNCPQPGGDQIYTPVISQGWKFFIDLT